MLPEAAAKKLTFVKFFSDLISFGCTLCCCRFVLAWREVRPCSLAQGVHKNADQGRKGREGQKLKGRTNTY